MNAWNCIQAERQVFEDFNVLPWYYMTRPGRVLLRSCASSAPPHSGFGHTDDNRQITHDIQYSPSYHHPTLNDVFIKP